MLNEVEQQLRNGDLRPGQRLASERALAERLRISRASVREGLRVLQALGLLRTVSGRGRESHTVVSSRTGEALSVALRLQTAAGGLELSDLIETRAVLEAAAMHLLAERFAEFHWKASEDRGNEDRNLPLPEGLSTLLEETRVISRQLGDPEVSFERFHELDAQFHDALARAAGNRLLATLIGALSLAGRSVVTGSCLREGRWETSLAGLRLQHSALLTALRRGDGATAAMLVKEHLRALGALLSAPGHQDPVVVGKALMAPAPGRRSLCWEGAADSVEVEGTADSAESAEGVSEELVRIQVPEPEGVGSRSLS